MPLWCAKSYLEFNSFVSIFLNPCTWRLNKLWYKSLVDWLMKNVRLPRYTPPEWADQRFCVPCASHANLFHQPATTWVFQHPASRRTGPLIDAGSTSRRLSLLPDSSHFLNLLVSFRRMFIRLIKRPIIHPGIPRRVFLHLDWVITSSIYWEVWNSMEHVLIL